MSAPVKIPDELCQCIRSVEGRSYKAYKSFQGTVWDYAPFELKFEHVQGDPFAWPTRLTVTVSLPDSGLPSDCHDTPLRRLALEDFLLRAFHDAVRRVNPRPAGSGKSGLITALQPGQKILKRSAVTVTDGKIELIHFVGLPADGRKILGRECLQIFAEHLPRIWHGCLMAESLNFNDLNRHWQTLEDYTALQDHLRSRQWTAFVADGSVLPRRAGNSDQPLAKHAVEFRAPEDYCATIDLPHRGTVRGLALPQGITLVVGGGFHGKSTLLKAVQSAVDPHIPGDGREAVATLPSAVKIRAEDGRAVREVDISAFMSALPGIGSTRNFSTPSASGSTSQAVNIIEALEAGTELLLMDEDTCASNFMIRDSRMQALVASDHEPITPLLDRIQEIYEKFGVSSLLVMGGSGDYFEPAHEVIAMHEFQPQWVTAQAKRIAEAQPTGRQKEIRFGFPALQPRRIDPGILSFNRNRKDCVIQARGVDALILGTTEVNTRYLEQISEEGQLETIGWILKRLKTELAAGAVSNLEGLKIIFAEMESQGLQLLVPYNSGLLTLPRRQEVLAVLNRIR